MTKVKYRDRPVWHETRAAVSGRPICIAESPSNLLMRLKGTRQVMQIDTGRAILEAIVRNATKSKKKITEANSVA